MQGKTRSQKQSLAVGLDKVTRRKELAKVSKVIEEIDVRIKIWVNVEPSVSPLLGEKESIPFQLSGETSSKTNTFRQEIPINIDRYEPKCRCSNVFRIESD